MKNRRKRRLIRNIFIVLALVIFIIILLVNKSFSKTEIKYKKMYISAGDTLWSIAKMEKKNNSYFKNKDILNIINEIKELNNLKSSELKIGNQLNIPTI